MRSAFERVSTNVQSLQGATSSGLIEEGDELIWSYRITDETIWPRRQDSEFSISTTLQMVRSFFDPDWEPVEIHFEHGEPSGIKQLEKLFQAPLVFGQSSNRIIFDRAGADKLYRAEDPALTAIIERTPLRFGRRSRQQPALFKQGQIIHRKSIWRTNASRWRKSPQN